MVVGLGDVIVNIITMQQLRQPVQSTQYRLRRRVIDDGLRRADGSVLTVITEPREFRAEGTWRVRLVQSRLISTGRCVMSSPSLQSALMSSHVTDRGCMLTWTRI